MRIRAAVLADVPRLVEMGQRFIASTSYVSVVADNPAKTASTATRLIEQPDSVILVAVPADDRPIGMIGMVVYDHFISGDRVAGEVFWWVEPDARGAGVRLLKHAERWARLQGATHLQMIAPSARVGAFYTRLGYAPVETTYQVTL